MSISKSGMLTDLLGVLFQESLWKRVVHPFQTKVNQKWENFYQKYGRYHCLFHPHSLNHIHYHSVNWVLHHYSCPETFWIYLLSLILQSKEWFKAFTKFKHLDRSEHCSLPDLRLLHFNSEEDLRWISLRFHHPPAFRLDLCNQGTSIIFYPIVNPLNHYLKNLHRQLPHHLITSSSQQIFH